MRGIGRECGGARGTTVTYFSIIINVALATSSSLSGVITQQAMAMPSDAVAVAEAEAEYSGSQTYTATATSL